MLGPTKAKKLAKLLPVPDSAQLEKIAQMIANSQKLATSFLFMIFDTCLIKFIVLPPSYH